MQFPQNVFPLLIANQIRISNNGAILFYSGVPAHGNLVGALSSQGGTDAFGNVYPAGSVWGVNNLSSYVQQGIGESGYEVDFFSDFTHEQVGSRIYEANHINSGGTTEFGALNIESPIDDTQQDSVGITMFSSSADGTTQNAEMVFAWNKIPSIGLILATAGFFGFSIPAGSITAVHPGTGTSRSNLAVAETWQTATITNANWTTVGASNPVRYKKYPDNTVAIDGEILTVGTGPWAANTTLFQLGTGYMPAQSHPFITRSDIAVAAGQDTVNVLTTSGSVQNGQAFTAAGQRLFFDGVRFGLD